MSGDPAFLLTTCQVGAEPVLKRELARRWPGFRFAYSRPGFLTFKLPAEHRLREDFDLGATFARWHGFGLGKATGEMPETRLAAVQPLVADQTFDALQVFERDRAAPGDFGFEPTVTPLALDLARALRTSLAGVLTEAAREAEGMEPAPLGARVLSVCLVSETEWWLAVHRVRNVASSWPGGLGGNPLPPQAVSRAYAKLVEGLAWSQLPLKPGDICLELGCAPGGAAQALLEQGYSVIGADPADVDPIVAAHPRFQHVRRRGHELKKQPLRDVRWLFADMNVAPSYTLDTVESIATHRDIPLQGMLLTLKLLEWRLADELPDYVARVQSWGFPAVDVRQLSTNRQEVCLAARRA